MTKNPHFVIRARGFVLGWIVMSLFVGWVATGSAASPVLGKIPVQEGGRKKPYSTLARESLLVIAGRDEVKLDGRKREALDLITGMWLQPEGWEDLPIVLVNHLGLKKELGLDEKQKRFSARALAGNEKLGALVMRANREQSGGEKKKPDRLLQEAQKIAERIERLQRVVSGDLILMVPPPDGSGWLPPVVASQAYPDPKGKAIEDALARVRVAYGSGGVEATENAARDLREAIAGLGAASYPERNKIELEDFYYRLHPFGIAWKVYAVAGAVLFLTSGWATGFGYRAAWLFALLGFAAQIYGFVCRVTISGRPPVTNMYESILWVAFGTILFALVFEAIHRCRYFLMGAIPVAVVSLILADTQPLMFSSAIQPLVPVLRDNFWLTTHVLTITISYAAFALALGVGHTALIQVLSGREPSKALYLYIYRAMQAGVALLATGTILGGVWANYSWGRFWGWDPKEVWALVALLGYLFVLHGRLAGWWGGFGLAVGSVLGFLSVLMAWYGVNYVLGAGLHSYGFGAGGFPVVVAIVVLDLLFVGAAILRHGQMRRVQTA